jgi:DNA (cytosine-5)-methyltransferase 1
LAGADLVWANDVDLNSIPAFDILTAGFPCQSFSVLGNQKGFADPRGTMYYDILRVIDKIRPQIVLLENVKKLVQHDSGRACVRL